MSSEKARHPSPHQSSWPQSSFSGFGSLGLPGVQTPPLKDALHWAGGAWSKRRRRRNSGSGGGPLGARRARLSLTPRGLNSFAPLLRPALHGKPSPLRGRGAHWLGSGLHRLLATPPSRLLPVGGPCRPRPPLRAAQRGLGAVVPAARPGPALPPATGAAGARGPRRQGRARTRDAGGRSAASRRGQPRTLTRGREAGRPTVADGRGLPQVDLQTPAAAGLLFPAQTDARRR